MTTREIRERIWLIADGIPLTLNNLTIRATDSGKLLVIGWTDTVHFKNVTRAKSLQEMNTLKTSYAELSSSYKELNDIVENNNLLIEYHVSYDDGGKTEIGICSEIEGKLSWYID
ncbi:MAG: hypothetical protein EOO90_17470 [Pedobacter sp.]|nr:MAG: hypothetical protein EOO90_17470 [Pedobacter sp.]